MFDRLKADIHTALAKDPAATSATEVVLTHPGLHAIWAYRVAHWLWGHDRQLLARLVSHITRFLTGVEIHPAAEIGEHVFIDHGMSIVIGETAEIGDDMLLYHGVTLGGTSMRREKRHPTVEDGATIGADASIMGPITVGENAFVGAALSSLTTWPRRRRWSAIRRNPSALLVSLRSAPILPSPTADGDRHVLFGRGVTTER